MGACACACFSRRSWLFFEQSDRADVADFPCMHLAITGAITPFGVVVDTETLHRGGQHQECSRQYAGLPFVLLRVEEGP